MKNEQKEKETEVVFTRLPEDNILEKRLSDDTLENLVKWGGKNLKEVYINQKEMKEHKKNEKYFLLENDKFLQNRKVFKDPNFGKNFFHIGHYINSQLTNKILKEIQEKLDELEEFNEAQKLLGGSKNDVKLNDDDLEKIKDRKEYKEAKITLETNKNNDQTLQISYPRGYGTYNFIIKNNQLVYTTRITNNDGKTYEDIEEQFSIKNIEKGDHITMLSTNNYDPYMNRDDFYNAISRINDKNFKNMSTLYCKNIKIPRKVVNLLQTTLQASPSGPKPKYFMSQVKEEYKYTLMEVYDKNQNDIVGLKTIPYYYDYTTYGKVDLKDVNKNKYKYFDYYYITKDKIYKVPYNLVKNRVDLIDKGKFDEEFEKAPKIECELDEYGNIIEKHRQIIKQINKLDNNILDEKDKENLTYIHERADKIKHFRTDKSRYNDALISFIKTASEKDLKNTFNNNNIEIYNKNNADKIQNYKDLSNIGSGVRKIIKFIARLKFDGKQKSIFLIDEPEQNLHPKFQKILIDFLEKAGIQCIFTSHSPTFVKHCMNKENCEVLICEKDKEDKVEVKNMKDKIEKDYKFLKNHTNSQAVANFLAFGEYSTDLHNLLYGLLEEKDKTTIENGELIWYKQITKDKYEDKNQFKSYEKITEDGKYYIKECNKSIHYIIRNLIHHPENKLNEDIINKTSDKLDDKEQEQSYLKQSINEMINFLKNIEN